MATTSIFHVVRAEPIGDGVFIEFSDGKSAQFPSSFLRAHYPWFAIGPVEEGGMLPTDDVQPFEPGTTIIRQAG